MSFDIDNTNNIPCVLFTVYAPASTTRDHRAARSTTGISHVRRIVINQFAILASPALLYCLTGMIYCTITEQRWLGVWYISRLGARPLQTLTSEYVRIANPYMRWKVREIPMHTT